MSRVGVGGMGVVWDAGGRGWVWFGGGVRAGTDGTRERGREGGGEGEERGGWGKMRREGKG